LAQYHLTFDHLAHESRRGLRSDDAEGELVETSHRNWHGGLPNAPADLFDQTSFRLGREEAEYIQERILTSVPGTFLAHLVQGRRPPDRVDAPWLYPELDRLPRELQVTLEHARRFSILAQGAQLIYNLMMAEMAVESAIRTDSELVDRYRDRVRGWTEAVRPQLPAFRAWDRGEFWALVRGLNPSLRHATYRFADSWMAYALEDPATAADRREVRSLIGDREWRLKGGLARLRSRRALERWNGESGTGQLTFRWNEGRRVAADIIDGLTRKDRPSA
jgi:hypothetical protein